MTADHRPPMITSLVNERIKRARRVREGCEPDLIFVEGERLVEECLQSGLNLSACFHSPALTSRARAILEEIVRRNCPVFSATEAVMATLSDTVSPQGIVLLAARPKVRLEEIFEGSEPLLVCLDAIQDPGNFGTIIRTAEAAGATGIIALKGSVEAFSPKTLRSAMGSAFRLPVVTGLGTEELLTTLHAKGVRIVATASDGETIYSEYDWRRPTMVIMGNEARGVRRELLERCDARLRIRLHPQVESLNVAAAAAVVLFEAARQRW